MALTACQAQPGLSTQPLPGIAFVSQRDGNWEIYVVQADGSGLTRLTDNDVVDSEPAWSPDGKQIAYRSRLDGSSDIFIMGADGSDPVNLIRDPAESWDDEFAPSFRPGTDELALYTDRPPFDTECRVGGVHQLAFMTIDGGAESITHARFALGENQSLAWSPDGSTLAFSQICNGAVPGLYLWDSAMQTVEPLTPDGTLAVYPAWSPDGRQLAFVGGEDGNNEILVMDLASGAITNVTQHPARDTHPTWSPDGTMIAFVSTRDGNEEIYVLDLASGESWNVSNDPAEDFWPSWSPVLP